MSRIRQIKPEFYLDDELAQCSRDARLLFPGLWILADRAGRLENRPAKIKAQVFPYDNDIDAAKTRELLEQLESRRFILIYEVDGRSYIQIRTFEKHQHCHRNEQPSQIPEPIQDGPSGKANRVNSAVQSEQYGTDSESDPNPEDFGANPEHSVQNPSTRGTYTSTYTSTITSTSGERVAGLDARSLFQIFWEYYPLKVKKPKALAAFLKLKPDRPLLDRILESIDRQKQSRGWRKDNGQFIPHPATWLNNRQWEDEIQPNLPEASVWEEFIGKPGEEDHERKAVGEMADGLSGLLRLRATEGGNIEISADPRTVEARP